MAMNQLIKIEDFTSIRNFNAEELSENNWLVTVYGKTAENHTWESCMVFEHLSREQKIAIEHEAMKIVESSSRVEVEQV